MLLLPVHFKRIVFLTTLYSYMRGKDEPSATTLEELNQALTLATTDSRALVIPSMLTKWIWQGDGTDVATWPDEKIKARLLRRCPCWLNYGRDADLLTDIAKLQQFVAARA